MLEKLLNNVPLTVEEDVFLFGQFYVKELAELEEGEDGAEPDRETTKEFITAVRHIPRIIHWLPKLLEAVDYEGKNIEGAEELERILKEINKEVEGG